MARTLTVSPLPPPTNAEWDALVTRGGGWRFYAVRTTGVGCRQGCPARTPLRKNVTVAPTLAAAQAAGFRACLRCRPA